MKLAHIIAEVLKTPWAILDDKFDAVVSVLARREADERYSEDEIRAVVGDKKAAGGTLPWVVDETGVAYHPAVIEGQMVQSAYEAAATGGAKGKLIAVLPVYGIIMPRAGDFDMSEYGTSIEGLRKSFRAAMNNGDVKAIVMDFDSPGGSVYHVDEFAQEIFDAREQKRVVAQINPLCASAAYYLASQCSDVAMTPSGEVGSIGVRMMHQDLSKALEIKGIKITNIFAGKFKVEGGPTEPLNEEAKSFLQKRVNEYYEPFVNAVARGRGEKSADVRKGFGEGRVVGARDARAMNMIDRIASLDDTIAGLGGDNAQRVRVQAEVEQNVTTAEAEHKEVLVMSTVANPAVDAATIETRAKALAEATRCDKLTALAKMHNATAKLSAWINGDTSYEAAQAELLTDLRASARPIQGASRVEVTKDVDDKTQGSIRIARMGRCLAHAHKYAGGDRSAAVRFAQTIGDAAVVRAFEAASPQIASTVSGGGALVPENFVPDLIEFLRPAAVFRSMGPASYPLVNGNISFPRLSVGGMATYVGEAQKIAVSQATTNNVKGSAKKLAAIIPISNDLLRFAGLSVDAGLRDDMVLALAQAEDAAFIRGEGSQYSPKGLLFQALAANKVNASLTKAQIATNIAAGQTGLVANLDAVFNDFAALELALVNANVRMIRPGVLMSRRSEVYFKRRAVDGLGNRTFAAEMAAGMFMGYPYKATTVIPNNLSVVTAGVGSEIYLADFADIVIADAPTISVEVSNEASYVDGDGLTHNAFQEDVTLIRVIEEHDEVVRHAESIAVLQGVEYGA